MKIHLIVNKQYDQNCYCVFSEDKQAVVIDPGSPAGAVKDFLDSEGLELKGILLTHGHFDHIISAEELRDWSGAPVSAARAEAGLLRDPWLNLSALALDKGISLVPSIMLDDGAAIPFGGETLQVIATPGHTPGGVCFYSKENSLIFTGDTMFWETVGRTDFNLGDGEALTRSVKERLLVLPANTIVYPGHGRATDIRHERMIHAQVY